MTEPITLETLKGCRRRFVSHMRGTGWACISYVCEEMPRLTYAIAWGVRVERPGVRIYNVDGRECRDIAHAIELLNQPVPAEDVTA